MRQAYIPAAQIKPHLPRLQNFAEYHTRAHWNALTTRHGIIKPIPKVILNTRLKTTGGWAYHEKNEIELSAGLLWEFPDEYKKTIIPHELIHLIDYILYKNSGHGPTWKDLMRQYGLDPARCHDLFDIREQRKCQKMMQEIARKELEG